MIMLINEEEMIKYLFMINVYGKLEIEGKLIWYRVFVKKIIYIKYFILWWNVESCFFFIMFYWVVWGRWFYRVFLSLDFVDFIYMEYFNMFFCFIFC